MSSGVVPPEFEATYNTLTMLMHGVDVKTENWILLLTKAMTIVSELKAMPADKKVELCVMLAIKYLDDYTDIDHSGLVAIKSAMHSTCLLLLEQSGVLGKKKKTAMETDPDQVVSAQQISERLMKLLLNTVRTRNYTMETIGTKWVELVVLLVSSLEKYTHLSGLEKKNLLIALLRKFLTEELPGMFEFTSQDVSMISLLADSLPFIIDTVVNVGRGKVNLSFEPAQVNALLACLTALCRK